MDMRAQLGARAGVAADAPLRAREAAKAERAASRPAATVQVEQLTPASAARAGRYAIPETWFGHELVVKVSPVLADTDSPEAGLLLASVPVVVCEEQERGSGIDLSAALGQRYGSAIAPTLVVTAWGADSTLRQMTNADWRFVVGAGRGIPVPAFVSSHLRALAYYSAIPGGGDVEGLRRWKAATDQVVQQVELLQSVFGAAPPSQPSSAVLDMTGEQVLRHRDRDLAAAWCQQARHIATSSKAAHARAARKWMNAQRPSTEDTLTSVAFYASVNDAMAARRNGRSGA